MPQLKEKSGPHSSIQDRTVDSARRLFEKLTRQRLKCIREVGQMQLKLADAADIMKQIQPREFPTQVLRTGRR